MFQIKCPAMFKFIKDSNRFSRLDQGAGGRGGGWREAGDLLEGESYRGHTDAEGLFVLLLFTK